LQREGKNAAILNDDAPIATASALIDVRPEARPASPADPRGELRPRVGMPNLPPLFCCQSRRLG